MQAKELDHDHQDKNNSSETGAGRKARQDDEASSGPEEDTGAPQGGEAC